MIELNSAFALRDQGTSNALSTESEARHRWYFVKEGFSPALVKHAIKVEELKSNDLLLDPFSGSGTTALTGVSNELRAEGFEVNPFLWFVSKAKLSSPRTGDLRNAGERVLRAARNQVESPLEGYSTFTRGNPWNRWLFPLSVLRTFEAGLKAADAEERGTQRLLKLALIGAAMDCCNATRDGKCLRYKRDWASHQVQQPAFRARFATRLEQMTEDIDASFVPARRATILRGDARRLVLKPREKFRLCVTSPPYLNSFDYSDVYRPEMFLGRFVGDNRELMKVRLRTVRSHLQATWRSPTKEKFGELYAAALGRLQAAADGLWNPKLPEMVQAYFEDMEIMLRGLRVRAAKNASLWVVVSTSAYAGVEIPVDLILAEVGKSAGWFLREVGVLRYLRSSGQHMRHVDDVARKPVPLRESVIIFDANI